MKKKLVICLSLFICLFIIGIQIFKVKQINCSTQFGSCSTDMYSKLQILQNSSLLLPLPQKSLSRQFANQKQIKSITLHRQFPASIKVDIFLRIPLGIANNFLIGTDGVILGSSTDANLPKLDYPQGDLSSKLDPSGTKSLIILQQLSNFYNSSLSARLTQNLLEITTPRGQIILLDITKPDSEWYSPLQLILDRSKISLKSPKTIDLRFNQPVLTY